MRFILLEGPDNEPQQAGGVGDFEVKGYPIDDPEGRNNLFKLTPELIREFKTADPKRQETILKQYLNSIKLVDFIECYKLCCGYLGLDETMNPFMKGLPILIKSQKSQKDKIPYFNELIKMVVSRDIPKERIREVSNTYLVNNSLYQRNIKDFVYTVKVFEIVMDESKLLKFLKDFPAAIDESGNPILDSSGNPVRMKTSEMIKMLFDGDKIKPAGSASTAIDRKTGNFSTDNIYGIVEYWSKGNDAGGKGRVKNSFDMSNSEVSKEVRDAAKQNAIYSFNEIPKDAYVRGKVLYIKTPVSGNLSPEEFVNASNPGYYQYDGKKWVRLNRYK